MSDEIPQAIPPATPKKRRLFLAVDLSVATTRKIAESVDRMRRAAEGKAKIVWVPPTHLHVTLKFLGWTNSEAVEAIRDRVGEGARTRKGFELRARGTGAFPSVEHPRVLWVGVTDGSGALAKLAADVDGWMEQLGFQKEERPYHPHVTVGRVKDGSGAGEILVPHRETDFGNSLIREVVLYESTMKSGASVYEALARMPLDVPNWRAERQSRSVEGDSTDQQEPDNG